MKKTGFTLVELMVSVAILSIILGVIGLITTSFMDTYKTGKRNEETGDKIQAYFAMIIEDLTPEDEDDLKKYVEIKKTGNPVDKVEIRRSWYKGKENEYVVYEYSAGTLNRGEYAQGKRSEIKFSRILSTTSNFSLKGIDISVSESTLNKLKRITDKAVYKEIEDLGEWKKLGGFDDKEERFNYYIEPSIMVGDQTYARGYGLRFAPKGEIIENNSPFIDVIAMWNGELKFEKESYTKKSKNGTLQVGIINQNNDEENTCRILANGEKDKMCEAGDRISDNIFTPGIEYGDKSEKIDEEAKVTITPEKYALLDKLEIRKEAKVIFKEGVYRIGQLQIGEEVKIEIPDGERVKIYTEGVYINEEALINWEGAAEQLLIINNGNNFTIKEESRLRGFVYSRNGKVLLDKEVEMIGAILADKEVELKEESYVEYDQEGAVRIDKDSLQNLDKLDWEVRSR